MSIVDNQIMTLLSWDLLRQAASGADMPPNKLNMLTTLLTGSDIPFDLSYVPGNRKTTSAAQLTIHINPVTTLVFAIGLGPGANVYSPSP